MRYIREILRLKWRVSRSHRETVRSLGVSADVVASLMSRASGIGLTWDTLEGLTGHGVTTSWPAAKPA